MQRDKEWGCFIQKVANPLEIYMFSTQQLKLTQVNSKKLLKMSRNSLYIDSTGGVVSKFVKYSKRVFLYSIVLYVKDKNGKGILIPIAEALT